MPCSKNLKLAAPHGNVATSSWVWACDSSRFDAQRISKHKWYLVLPGTCSALIYVLHFSWFFWGIVFFSCISYQAALLATAPTAAPCERCRRIAPAWRPLPRQQGLPVPAPVKADETWALSDPRRDEIDVKPLSMVFLAFHCLLC